MFLIFSNYPTVASSSVSHDWEGVYKRGATLEAANQPVGSMLKHSHVLFSFFQKPPLVTNPVANHGKSIRYLAK